MKRARLLVVTLALIAACGSSSSEAPDAAADATAIDAGKEAGCASTFGAALTNAFGRIDGTVTAVVAPGIQSCAMPNSDHLVVQVEFGGDVYRMVVNVESNGADPKIRLRTFTGALPAPAFAPGWHPGLTLDYANDLGVHSGTGWDALALADAAARVAAPIEIGAPIAVYATSSGGTYAHSAHLVHRNGGGHDGALVIDPMGASPTWYLFAFADQTF